MFTGTDWIIPYYQRAKDFSLYNPGKPLSDRRALIISDSFGAAVVRDLAAGFKSLHHVNITALKPEEYPVFFGHFINGLNVSDVIFIFHDTAVINGFIMNRVVRGLEELNTNHHLQVSNL